MRNTVGMVDVSTLGKIMVQGPDAGEFLNRVYSNPFAKLPVGKARYGLMLRDDGIVFDDGTTWRLSETDWFMTTTTANAGPVMLHLANLLQTRWPELRVHITSVSDAWGGVAIAGPRARAVLDGACPDIDFSDEAFPFMGVRQGHMRVGAGRDDPGHVGPAVLLGRDGVGGDVPGRFRARDVAGADDCGCAPRAACPTGWRRWTACASRRAT